MPIISGTSGGGERLLAFFQQTAGTNKVTNSATLVDVDAVNAAVTFTPTSSGKVLIRCSAEGLIGAVNVNCFLGLREASAIVAGPTICMQGPGTVSLQECFSIPFVVSGITVASHTYKLAFACDGVNNFTIHQVGSAAVILPVTMEVWAL